MVSLIITLLFSYSQVSTEIKNSEYFIEFDNVTVQLAKKQIGNSDCESHFIPRAALEQIQPKKIVNTNIPKFISMKFDGNNYWFKICKA